jgi:type I restriction enzyme S subunit
MQNQLINMAKGSAQPNLSPVETGKIELTIPSRGALDKFSEVASPVYERLVKNADENQRLAALRDLLLPKLMSGEVRA